MSTSAIIESQKIPTIAHALAVSHAKIIVIGIADVT